MNRLRKILTMVVCASALMEPGRNAAVAATAAAQQDDVISRIDARMTELDRMIHHSPAPAVAPEALAGRIEVNPDTLYEQSVEALTDARIGQIKAETGVQFTGQAYYRPDSALGFADEDDPVSPYVGKIQVEARWYFLQSGLLKRAGRINEQRLRGQLDCLQHERDREQPGLYARREALRTVSDSVLASVMRHRVENLNLLEEAYLFLLGAESISSDELLKILDERSEAERRLSTISTAPTLATSLSSVRACTVSIDTTALLGALTNTDLDLKILGLKGELLDQQAANTTWWSDVRLAPFVRYSHYFRPALKFSQNVDAGLSFTIPVNIEASRRRQALRAEKAQLDSEREDLVAKAADRIRYLTLETDRLNRAITAEWRRAQALKQYLQTRRTAYDNRAGEYNRLAALKEYNIYLRCLESIVEMQYRRDSYIADLQAIVPAVPILSHCIFTPLTAQVSDNL